MYFINDPYPARTYRKAAQMNYFIDKSCLIDELLSSVKDGVSFLCITRPRRFGKSYGANMVASFFGKAGSMHDFFASQKIGKSQEAMQFCGKYDVIFIRGDKVTSDPVSGREYAEIIRSKLVSDLITLYPNASIPENSNVSNAFSAIGRQYPDAELVIVMDEWDFLLTRCWSNEEDHRVWISFLNNMNKDESILKFSYFTGVLPMPVFSSVSDLNMFKQFTMEQTPRFSTCFGFTEEEIDELYKRHCALKGSPKITRSDLREWYEGYSCAKGRSIYNPQSVVFALSDDVLDDYWCASGADDEIFSTISGSVGAVRDDIAKLSSGLSVPLKLRLKKARGTKKISRDALLSKMVVLGFLSYSKGMVRVPNLELMQEFEEMVSTQPELDYVYQLASKSEEALKAVMKLDSETLERILEYAHNTESPLLQYNNESDLTVVVVLTFLQARNSYRMEREAKSGTGYVDFIFYPKYDMSQDGIILELKVDNTPENALQQIEDRQYVLNFQGKLGESPYYRGRIIGVGIAYDKKTKKHSCIIRVLREKIKF